MRLKANGFSTLGLAFLLMFASLLLGGLYYMKGQAKTALTDKKLVIYNTEKSNITPQQGKKALTGGECDLIGENPNLSKRFDNTDARTCGSLPAGATNVAALNQIRSCILDAVAKCQETKSYIYQQGFEGSVEHLITTNNCEIFVERWGTTDPYCGSELNACKTLSENFPDQICPDFIKDDVAAPTPKIVKATEVPHEDEGILLCNSVLDCNVEEMKCVPKSSACESQLACLNNECICVDVC